MTTKKTIKTVLFASLITALILPLAGMEVADAQSTNTNGQDKTKEIETRHNLIIEDLKIVDDLLNKTDSLTQEIEKLKDDDADDAETQQELQRLETQLEEVTAKFNEKVVKHNEGNNTPDAQIQKMISHQALFEQKLRSSDLLPYVTTVGIDLGTKEIQVGFDNSKLTAQSADTVSGLIAELMPDDAEWHYVFSERVTNDSCNQQVCTPLVGGNKIVVDGMDCSMAFEATKSGVNGFVTAGHCVDGKVGYSAYDGKTSYVGLVNSETRYSGSDCDCAFINTSASAVDNKVWDGSSTVTFTGTMSTSAQSNDYVWKSGYKSGVTYGKVTGINVTTYSWDSGWTDKLVRATYSSQTGDSGGAVYSGSDIYGVHMGSNVFNTFYSPVDEVVSVLGASPVLG